MNRKKVLFYTSGIGLGGVEKVLLEILQKIDRKKFDIKVAFQYGNEDIFEYEIPEEIDYSYMLSKSEIEKTLKIRSNRNLLNRVKYNFRLIKEKRIIKKNYLKYSKDRDIVIDFKSGDFAKLVFKNKKAKKIVWFHTSIPTINRYSERKSRISKILDMSDKIVCVCKEMKEELVIEFQEISHKVTAIYNGLDYSMIQEKSVKNNELSKVELEYLKERYIVMVSRLEEKQKDFYTLIKAFEKVLQIEKELKLYIIGDGPDRDSIQNRIKKIGLEGKIILLGRKENPYIWIKKAEMLVHSSLFEGFGLVILEALILKKKIVSTDFKTGAKELLDNGRLGRLVPIGDIDDMAEAIIETLKNGKKFETELEGESLNQFNKNLTILEIENLLMTI